MGGSEAPRHRVCTEESHGSKSPRFLELSSHQGFVNRQTFWEHFGRGLPGKRTPDKEPETKKKIKKKWLQGHWKLETRHGPPTAPGHFGGNVGQGLGSQLRQGLGRGPG